MTPIRPLVGSAVAALALTLAAPVAPVAMAGPVEQGAPRWVFDRQWATGAVTNDPQGVTVGTGGDVWVVMAEGQVRRYSATGRLRSSFTVDFQPTAVAVGPMGRLHLADYFGDAVRMYGPGGAPVGQYTPPADVTGNFAPLDITIAGNIAYVLDPVSSRVYHFNLATGRAGHWGTDGSRRHQLDSPQSLTLLPRGRLAIADYGNARVKVFRRGGGFVRQFGRSGLGRGEFGIGPTHVEYVKNRFLVADAASRRVQVFGPTGRVVGQLPSGRLRTNTDVGAASGGAVYVAGYQNLRRNIGNAVSRFAFRRR